MEINYNDTLQKRMLNWIYYGDNMNPFYSCVISYLIEIGGYKLSKDGSEYEQIKKLENILKTNPKIFKEILKTLTQNGFLEDLSFRYEYSNKFYKNRGDENYFSILKFKIIDGKLYAYDLITSRENRKYVEIKQINNIDVNELITLLKNDGYTDEEAEVLIQHKEVLSSTTNPMYSKCATHQHTFQTFPNESEFDEYWQLLVQRVEQTLQLQSGHTTPNLEAFSFILLDNCFKMKFGYIIRAFAIN